ncbi:MAG: glycosyl hydrolase, partial [Bacteroidetes bacterium]
MTACRSSQESINADQDRPYDPWISRSVLDEQARMITIALHDDLWVAYSTQNCSLYKTWKGYVNFEGAVYNTAHGPQPVSVGDAFIENVFDNPWRITQGQSEVSTQAKYAGHRKRNGHAELMYDLYAKGVGPVRVYEMIDYTVNDAGQLGLSRSFTTENVPEGYGVMFLTNINSIVSQADIKT